MSNPNIALEARKWRHRTPNWKDILTNISKERSTGAKTRIGKLKVSLNAIKHYGRAGRINIIKTSDIIKWIEEIERTNKK